MEKVETRGSGSGTGDWTTGPGFSVPTGQKLIRLGRSTRLDRLHLAWLGDLAVWCAADAFSICQAMKIYNLPRCTLHVALRPSVAYPKACKRT